MKTEIEMEQMSLDELKAAEAADAKPKAEAEPVKAEPEPEPEPEIFVARREIDLGDGSGVQVFEADGESEKDALGALADKIADAQRNATKKIREQEAELRELRAKTVKAEPKTISDDDEYVFAQELQKKPLATLKKMWKELTGYDVEDFTTTKQAADAVTIAQRQNEAANVFLATHPDFDDQGEAGTKNAQLMKMKLAELRLPVTSENLSKAYSQLKQSGLLALKSSEEANANATEKTEATERIAQPKVETAQARTRRTSTISTHSRTTAAPVNTEPSEDEMYKMPMEELRARGNRQLSTR